MPVYSCVPLARPAGCTLMASLISGLGLSSDDVCTSQFWLYVMSVNNGPHSFCTALYHIYMTSYVIWNKGISTTVLFISILSATASSNKNLAFLSAATFPIFLTALCQFVARF